MNLLRIAQEAVGNAVKHGRAQQVDIELVYSSKSFCLSVADNGKGFVVNQNEPAGHFGLLDMRERAQAMGTQLTLESEVGRGTRVAVELSVDSKATVHSSEVNNADLKTNTYSGR